MPRKIIFDTDPGVDDCAALLLAHRHPALQLCAVTTVFGNATIADVTRNALYLKDVYGFDAPVAGGAGRPLSGAMPGFPPAHIHGGNGLGDIPIPDTLNARPDPRPAHQLIIDLIHDNPHEIKIVAVGRMTNLALALQDAPEIAELVDEIIIMGGAFGFHGLNGNVTPVAEANISGDPLAADKVFTAPWKVTAIGLDVTRQVRLTPEDFARLEASGDSGCRTVADASRIYMTYHERFGVKGCYVHDSSAVAYAIDPSLFTLKAGPIRVVTEGIASGQTIQRDPSIFYPPGAWDNQPVQHAAHAVDANAVRELILSTWMGGGA